ncbi:glycine cleavage system protein GcvH [Saccharopolyspora erythraea]|uniref:glycine cleavage system protein GcvH n=1 Tax=Saccharopolyspora erythraea TaxID=1836 RepID=UPI001BA838B3|nr:glycine cleavage system protein GcvH [Saccharopolyspora erythraea]QUH02734.1 glycine cleavage system protein GcvH [Saccharopolyspora erythraea]
MTAPERIRYTSEHEWVLPSGENTVRVGITDYAQRQLGDVVFVQLPDEGSKVSVGESMGEVESTKSVSELYAPVEGEVVKGNERLGDEPDLVNTDPFGDGWMVEIRLADPAALDQLLDENAYQQLTDQD